MNDRSLIVYALILTVFLDPTTCSTCPYPSRRFDHLSMITPDDQPKANLFLSSTWNRVAGLPRSGRFDCLTEPGIVHQAVAGLFAEKPCSYGATA
jgi:hypothetical protein